MLVDSVRTVVVQVVKLVVRRGLDRGIELIEVSSVEIKVRHYRPGLVSRWLAVGLPLLSIMPMSACDIVSLSLPPLRTWGTLGSSHKVPTAKYCY